MTTLNSFLTSLQYLPLQQEEPHQDRAPTVQFNAWETSVLLPEQLINNLDYLSTNDIDGQDILRRPVTPSDIDEELQLSPLPSGNLTHPMVENNQLPTDNLLPEFLPDQQPYELPGTPEELFARDNLPSLEQTAILNESLQISIEHQTAHMRLQEADEEARKLSNEVTIKQQKLDNTQQQKLRLQTENQLLTAQLNKAIEDKQHLNLKVTIIQHERDSAQQQISQLQTKIEQQKAQINKSVRFMELLRHDADTKQQKLDNTQQEVTQLKNREKQHKKELTNQRTEIQQVTQQAKYAKNQAKQALNLASNQKTSLNEADNQIQKLRQKKAQQQKALQNKAARQEQRLSQKITIKQQELEKAQSDSKTHLITIKNLGKAKDHQTSLKIQAEQRATTAQNHSSQLNRQVLDQQVWLDNVKKETQDLKNTTKDNQQKLLDAQQQITLLQAKTQQLEIELTELSIEAKTKEQQVKNFQNHTEQMHNQIEGQKIRLNAATGKAQCLNNKIVIKQQELNKTQQQTKELTTRNQQQETELDELTLRNQQQEAGLNELRTQAKQTEQQITDFQKQTDQMRHQIKGQQIQLSTTADNEQYLNNKIAIKQQELDTTQHQVMELKAEHDKTTQKVHQLTQNTQAQEQELANEREKILQLQIKNQQQDQRLKFQHFNRQRISQRTIAIHNDAITLRSTLRAQNLEAIAANKQAEKLDNQLQEAQTHLENANQAALKSEQDMSQLKLRNQQQRKHLHHQHRGANQKKNQTIATQNKGLTQLRRKLRKRSAELDTMTANEKRLKASYLNLTNYVKDQAIAADNKIQNGQIDLENTKQAALTLQQEASHLNQQMTAKQLELDNAQCRVNQQDNHIQALQTLLNKKTLTSQQLVEDAKVKQHELDSSYQHISQLNTENQTQQMEQNKLRSRTNQAELLAQNTQTNLQQLQSSNCKLTMELDHLKRQKEQSKATNAIDSSKANPFAPFSLKAHPNSKIFSIDIDLNKLTKDQTANITTAIPSLDLKVTNVIHPSNTSLVVQMKYDRQQTKPNDYRETQNAMMTQSPMAGESNCITGSNGAVEDKSGIAGFQASDKDLTTQAGQVSLLKQDSTNDVNSAGSNNGITPAIETQLANRNNHDSLPEAPPAKKLRTRKSRKNTTRRITKNQTETILLFAKNVLKNITPTTSQPGKNLSEIHNMPKEERKTFYNSISDKEKVKKIKRGCRVLANRIKAQESRDRSQKTLIQLEKDSKLLKELMKKNSTP